MLCKSDKPFIFIIIVIIGASRGTRCKLLLLPTAREQGVAHLSQGPGRMTQDAGVVAGRRRDAGAGAGASRKLACGAGGDVGTCTCKPG